MIRSSAIDDMLRQQEEEWERMRREQARLEEEQARRVEEANADAQKAEVAAQEAAQQAVEENKAGAEAGAAASQAAAAQAHSAHSSAKTGEDKVETEKPKEPVVKDGKVQIGPTNRPFTEEQSFLLHQRKAVRETKTHIDKVGELDNLPAHLEQHREFFEEKNKKGEIIPSAVNNWGTNRIDINFGSIKDNDQAIYFATTLATDSDKLRFFKEYSERTKQNYQDILAYADDRLGARIFSAPQSDAGKRNLMYDEIDNIGLFDINGEDVNVGTADFDTVVQALNNIADEGKAKKAAAYVESLTKIPGSPYYGMMFDKDAVSYRDSANLPSQVYKDEVKDLSGSFYLGEDAIDSNLITYAEKYEVYQKVYGNDQYAFRQMKSALKDAYEKQTGYVAPEDSKVEAVIEETKAERALLAQEEAEKNKSGWDKFKDAVHSFFSGEKKEEEEVAPIEAGNEASDEAQPYAMRSGYIASAGPMSSGLLAENQRIKDTVENAVPQAKAPEAPEVPPEMQGPKYQPSPLDHVQVAQNQAPMSYMQAMAAHKRGEALSPENEALIADSIKNDDFMRYVVNGMTPDPQKIMQERAYGGTMLSDAQARVRAQSTTTGRQILGTQLGAAAEALGTGAMPEDVVGAGYQLMTDIMNGVSLQIRGGRIAVPEGENKYDYVIANTPHLKKKAEQLSALQKDVEGIMATRAIEAAHDYDKKVEDAEIRYLKGIATQEDLMMLHSRANPNADINDDETRMQFLAQLSGRSMWYQDDGAFWKGDSAAAQAGMRLRETRADGQYGDFKSALWDKAHDVIDELTYIAMDHGMTLGGWMEKVGLNIDDPRDIMDMAYNRIEAEGSTIGSDREVQQAVDALANVQTQGVGWMGARWGGFKHGLADDAYHFMNAGYLLMDEATYEARRNEIYSECVSEYGNELAPKVRRQILIAYANSGAMGKEKSQELLEDIERCDSIWDIPVDVDPGMIEGLYLSGLNEVDKYVEELESVRELLPDHEAKAWDRYFGHGTNVGAGARQVVAQSLAMAAGVPYSAAKNIGLVFGHGFSSFSRGTKKYEDAGLPRAAAMYMGGAEAFGMIVVNALGEDTVMSSLNGRPLMRNGMETAFRKGSWIGLAKEAAKKTLASAGTEAVQEVLEEGTSKTVELFTPTAKALSNGEQVSFSKSLQMAWDEFKNMDGKTLYKDLLQAGWGGVVYGGFYAAVGMAFETPRSVANAKLQKQYPSIDIASQIVHGEIPANEENMGRFIGLMREDIQKPEFRALMDKKNDSAEQANYVTVAAVLGEGKEFRDKAIKLTQTANQYDQKAEAAEKAVEINRSQFYTARKAAMDGNQGAAVTMEGFRTAWAKAQTTVTESRQAAQKKREEAAAETGRWIYACRKLGDNMYNLTKVRAGNLLMYKEQEDQADEMEPELAEAEANVEAMGVEEFIEQNYNNASDSDKDHIREIWGVPVNTKKEEEPEAATVSETETVAENATEQEAPVAENETSEQAEQVEQTAESAAAETEQSETDKKVEELEAKIAKKKEDASLQRGYDNYNTASRYDAEAKAMEKELEELKTKSSAAPEATAASETASEADTTAHLEQTEAAPQTAAQTATAAPEAPAKPVQTMTGEQRLEANRKRRIDSATKFLGQVGRRFNVKTELAPADDKRLMLPKLGKDGKTTYASALYNRETDTIIVSENASQGDILRAKVVHELTHRTENTDAYKEFSKAVQAAYFKGNEENKKAFERNIRRLYAGNGVNLSPEGLEHEVVSRITEELIGGNQEMVDRLVADSPSVARRIMDAIKGVLDKLRGVKGKDVDDLRAVEQMFQKALDESAKKRTASYQQAMEQSNHPASVQFSVEQLAEATGLDVRRNDDGVPYIRASIPAENYTGDAQYSIEDVPDNLMGFGRNQKGYDEQRYPKTVMVRVRFGDDVFEDEIKGMNKAHAMERARRNWEDADEISFVSMEDVRYSIDEPLALPDDDFLRAEIDAWRSNPNYSVSDDTGKRQFFNETLPANPHVPDYIKQAFLNDPTKAKYSRESNMRQMTEAWNRVQNEGYNVAVDRLLNQETKFDDKDNADALIIMRQALHEGDLDTFMGVAAKYGVEGTDQAKALQIRSMMRKMTPTGFAQLVVQDAKNKMDEADEKKPGRKRRVERNAKKAKEDMNLGSLDDTSAAEKLAKGESVVINSKFGSISEAKMALIKHFGLEKTARAGDGYNWATTKQRMLEDILTTDDIWARDAMGYDLTERLTRMELGLPTLTKADLDYINGQMEIFDRQADQNSRLADLALSRAHEAQGNINGVTGRMKRRTWRYVSMLTSVPSALRNFIGNFSQMPANAISERMAAGMDEWISKKFGTERTHAGLTAAERAEGWKAFRDELFNTIRDVYSDKTITRHGSDRYNSAQVGRVYQTEALETIRRFEGLLMSVGDRTFWKKKFVQSMAEQSRLAEINGAQFDVDSAMEIAEAEANYATFNEDSTVRSLMSALTEHVPFLDYLMPFVGVPTNIIKRQIEFSPVGLAYTALKHGLAAVSDGGFDQRSFVEGMSRGLTGSAMWGLGVLLSNLGFLKLGTKEEDDKSYGIRTAQGDQYGVYFTVGDKNYSITTFSPAASALVAGAFFMDALKGNQTWYQAAINATLKNINEIFDASYMSSLADALNTSNGKTFTENLIPAIGSAMVSQNIPAPLTHLATSLDQYVRDTKDKDALMEIVKTTMNKIPGARELLPEKVDVAGRAVRNTKEGAAAFYDPFTTSYVNDDPALNEMIRLRDVLEADGAKEPRAHMASDALSGRRNTLTQNKVTYTVTPEEKEAYRKLYGDLWRNGGITYDKKGKRVRITQGVEELIRSRSYQLMTPEEQAEEIKKILQKAKEGATYQIMNHK